MFEIALGRTQGQVATAAGISDRTARPRRVDQQRCEPLHPAMQCDVIHLDAAFREEFFKVSVRQPEPQIPAHCKHDHLRREPVYDERKRQRCGHCDTTTAVHGRTSSSLTQVRQRNSASRCPWPGMGMVRAAPTRSGRPLRRRRWCSSRVGVPLAERRNTHDPRRQRRRAERKVATAGFPYADRHRVTANSSSSWPRTASAATPGYTRNPTVPSVIAVQDGRGKTPARSSASTP